MSSLNTRLARPAALVLLPLALAACSSTPDWMKPGRWFQGESPAAVEGPYPELADIPATKPEGTPAEQRAATLESLAADRARADAAEQVVEAIEAADPPKPQEAPAEPGGS